MRFCPRCHLELGEIDQAGIVVDFCSQCRGIFCDAGELEQLVGRPIESRSAATSAEDETPCPACNGPMVPRDASGAVFRLCRSCNGTWLEAGVIGALRGFLPPSGGPSARPEPRLSGAAAGGAAPARVTSVAPEDAAKDRVVHDRLSFDAPLVDLLAYPIVALVGILVGVFHVGRPLAFIVQIWFHELGHAIFAWLSGRAALPLPFGFTFWREEPSIFTTLSVTFLIVVFGVASVREKRPFGIAAAAVLLALQVLCSFVIDDDAMIEWILFGGIAGELVLSTAAIVAFYYRAPDRFRWDFFRFVVLLPAATTFSSSLAMWIRIERGEENLPLGSIVGVPGDGTGDLDRLMAGYDWTGEGLTHAYRAIGLVCLAVIAVHYAFFGLRAWRRWHVSRKSAATTTTLVILLTTIASPELARAHTPPYEYRERAEPGSATLEVAPWLGIGGGASEVGGRDRGLVEVSLDVGLTLRISNELRAGFWGNARTASFQTFEPVGGVRFTWAPEVVHWFGVDGRWTIALDGGVGYGFRDAAQFGVGDGAVFVGRVSWGFTAPERLIVAYPFECEGPEYDYGDECHPPVGMVSGGRLYVALRRSVDEWEVTGGLEFELIGAAWLFMWLFG